MKFVGRALYLCTMFFVRWLDTRNERQFFHGTPAFVAAIALGGALVLASLPQHRKTLQHLYRAKAKQALEKDNPAVAEIYVGRLVQWGGRKEPWLEYALAQIAVSRGDIALARRLMTRIAPADKLGYGPAHLWMAKDSLQRTRSLDAASWNAVHHHLTQTVEDDPDNVEGHALLGQLYLVAEQSSPATGHLEQAVDQYPHLLLKLARIHLSQGDLKKAEAAARAASIRFAAAAQEAGGSDAHLVWAEAETLLGNYDQAADILRQQPDEQRDDRHRSALAHVHLVWGTKYVEGGDLAAALEHLEQALKHGLNTPELLNNLGWTLAHLDPPQHARALEMLSRAIEQAPRNAELRETRGQIYLQLGQYEDAITDFEVALPILNQRPSIHASLATAYERLGQQTMANVHRRFTPQLEGGARPPD